MPLRGTLSAAELSTTTTVMSASSRRWRHVLTASHAPEWFRLMDALLANPEVQGYQTWHTSGHGQVGAMSINEQVAGRRNRVLFEVVLDESTLESVLAALKATLPIADIIYWVLPITASGRFSS
jgi:Tfp pilus assembly protein PilV